MMLMMTLPVFADTKSNKHAIMEMMLKYAINAAGYMGASPKVQASVCQKEISIYKSCSRSDIFNPYFCFSRWRGVFSDRPASYESWEGAEDNTNL